MTLQVPYAGEAEREVVGCAVADNVGYETAAAVVAPEDFYTPRFGRAFASCAELVDVDRGYDSANRIRMAARLADADEAELRRLVDDRSLFCDTRARFARLVAEAARRRRAMVAFDAACRAVADGAALEDVVAIVSDVVGIAARQAA